MPDIELVIRIPEKWFDDMVREEFTEVDELCAIIQHSTVLPKGHGDLIDKAHEHAHCYECVKGMKDNYDLQEPKMVRYVEKELRI